MASMLRSHGLSVTFVHCAQTAEDTDTISLAYTTAPRLSQIALKFGLHRSTPSFANLSQSDPPAVHLSAGDIRWQIATKWLEIAQWSQWTAYRKPSSLFRMVGPSVITYIRLPLPQNGGPKCTQGLTSRRVLPPGEYDTRYGQDSCVLSPMSLWAERCRLLPNYFGRCFQLWQIHVIYI